jgi:hypothetical protein
MGTKAVTANGLSGVGPGKMHGGGINLAQGVGKISQSQLDVESGEETRMENDAMAKSGCVSGGHPKGGFMKKSTSYGNAKTGELEMVKKDGKNVPFYAADGDGENDLGTPKGKTAKSKLHQQKIHGKTYGYGKTIKPLVTVQADE